MMFERRAAMATLLANRPKNLFVVPGLGSCTWDAFAAGDDDRNFYLWGAMGGAAMIGLGLALAKPNARVAVITGDGELNEGILWEAVQSAAHMKLGRLIAFVDNNGWQSGGVIKDVSGLTNLAAPFAAFGWHTQEIDGHDFDQILTAIEKAKTETERPSVIVAHTIKGKGIPFTENDNSWHKRVPNKEELAAALQYLGGS